MGKRERRQAGGQVNRYEKEPDYVKAAREIKNGNLHPVYVFYGQETYLTEECMRLIENRIIDEASRDFNYSVYDLSEVPIEQVLQDAETLPFMGEKRLIIAKEAAFLTGSRGSLKVEHHLDALLAYLDQPAEHSILVLQTSQEKLDERKKLVKKLKKRGFVYAFPALKDQDLLRWIQHRADRMGVKIDAEAAELLVAMIGNSLRFLHNELEKMAFYVGEGGTIDLETVNKLSSRSLEQDIFALVDKAANVKLEEAFQILHDLLQAKEEPIKILQLFARQFRHMLQVKVLSSKGYSQKQMASALKLHPFVVKIAGRQAQRFTEKQLKKILHELAEEDYRMKSGQVDKVLALELFLHSLKNKMAT